MEILERVNSIRWSRVLCMMNDKERCIYGVDVIDIAILNSFELTLDVVHIGFDVFVSILFESNYMGLT